MPSHINDHTPEGDMIGKALAELHQKFDQLKAGHDAQAGAISDLGGALSGIEGLPAFISEVKATLDKVNAALPAIMSVADDVKTLIEQIRQATGAGQTAPLPPQSGNATA